MPRRTTTKTTTATTAPKNVVEYRFIAKPYGKQWRIYDRHTGSYPVTRPEFDHDLPEFPDETTASRAALDLSREFAGVTFKIDADI